MQSVNPLDEAAFTELYVQHVDAVYRICYSFLKNRTDAEDAVSEVFVKYLTNKKAFDDEEHKKAWLIRVAANTCKDMLRFYKIRNHINLDDISAYCKTDNDTNIVADLLKLPVKYRTVLYLYYIEGYKTAEISEMLSVSGAAVRKRLQYGREMLKLEYEERV